MAILFRNAFPQLRLKFFMDLEKCSVNGIFEFLTVFEWIASNVINHKIIKNRKVILGQVFWHLKLHFKRKHDKL